MTTQWKAFVKQAFSTKIGGRIYQMYFKGSSFVTRNGGEMLLHKRQILESLGIDWDSLDDGERALLDVYWDRWKVNWRSHMKERNITWGTLPVELPTGERVYMHGYTRDPAKLEAMDAYLHQQAVYIYKSEQEKRRAIQSAMPFKPSKQQAFELPQGYTIRLN